MGCQRQARRAVTTTKLERLLKQGHSLWGFQQPVSYRESVSDGSASSWALPPSQHIKPRFPRHIANYPGFFAPYVGNWGIIKISIS